MQNQRDNQNNLFWFLVEPKQKPEPKYTSQKEMAKAQLKGQKLEWIRRERAGLYL